MTPHTDDPAPKTSGETSSTETDETESTDAESSETPAPACPWKPGTTHKAA